MMICQHLLRNNFPFSMVIHGWSGHKTAKLFHNKYQRRTGG
jgi:hypothetical protein